MLAEEFDVGDVWRVGIFIRNASNVLADPANLTFTSTAPDGSATTYTWPTDTAIAHDGTGQFHTDVPITQIGTWSVSYSSTGALALFDPRIAVGVPAGTTARKANLRDGLRRMMQDGRTDDGQVFNVSRLEDLSDQIVIAATPSQVQFVVRFDSVPTGEYVTVGVVLGSLRAYVDGSPTPIVPAGDVDTNGNFTLAVPPTSSLVVSYAWQYLSDADMDSYIDQGRSWLLFGSITDVPDGLAASIVQYGGWLAASAMARKTTLASARGGDAEMAFESLAKAYAAQAKAFLDAATKARDDFYAGAGRAEQPSGAIGSLALGNYQPPR